MAVLQEYLERCLNMALGASTQGETTYDNSFSCEIKEEGFIFLPRFPAGYVVDDDLYQKIFSIASAALYPQYTLLKQNSAYFIPLNNKSISTQRALFFPWKKGISKRLVITDLDSHAASHKEKKIPLMDNLSLNYNAVTSILIAGNSGSGKSYMLTYLLRQLKERSDLVIVDPKFDTPSRWAREHGLPVIHPDPNHSKSDFVSEINSYLSKCLEKIHQRQAILYDKPNTLFKHLTIVIDEVLAISEGTNKAIKDSFFALLSQIALLGRATRIHLVLVSQRFDHTAIPVSVREQANVLIQIGNINRNTTQFLFPDLDPKGIVIPIGKGTGIIQIIDNEHPYQILPLLCPTYYTTRKEL